MRIPTYLATVVRVASVTPRMRRVTLGGPGLQDFASRDLPDERVKLLLPRPGRTRPALPEIDERGYRYPPGVERPISRTFTVRRFDPAGPALDIDIALHDGPAARWSLTAGPGDECGVAGPTGGYALGAGGHLVVGDEAALPAIATILERLPRDARATVMVEVGDPCAEQPLDSAGEAGVIWLRRNGEPTGALLVDAVRAYDWPEPARVWAAGEALAMRAIRRHLRDDLALPRERYQVVGYWRDRLSEDEAIEQHLRAQEAARAAGGDAAAVEDAGLY